MAESTIHLQPEFFNSKERLLVESAELRVSSFRYDSGVAALRLSNSQGELVMLPFQGQQIWSATFGGRNLTMRSMFDAPQSTSDYAKNYGGFLLHCGFTAMGVPTAQDDHPLHGELPNAVYQQAWLVLGEDENGAYIGLGGRYRHTVAFNYNYTAEPLVKLYAGSSLIHVSLVCHNLKQTPMEYMYLAHANFRPVDNGQLLYSAVVTPQTVRVRRSIPSHVKFAPDYLTFMDALGEKPELHHRLTPGLAFDPEIVFGIDYRADADGWAHTLQLHPDGNADYIRHRPEQLPVGVRWICRTPDQDAAGINLPATAEPEGYTAEKAKGYVKELAGGAQWRCDYVMGALGKDEAAQVAKRIEQIVG
ncbi:MAG: DUF4432 family protein [Chloroflexi bacterium]|nr:MAG: DUF4432 family protein [Chloroflexota bacterium]